MSENKLITSGTSQRIGEHFALTMTRYVSDGYDKQVLWRFGIGQYCGMNRATIQCDAVINELIQARNFLDEAIEILKTDGGRNTDKQEAIGHD